MLIKAQKTLLTTYIMIMISRLYLLLVQTQLGCTYILEQMLRRNMFKGV